MSCAFSVADEHPDLDDDRDPRAAGFDFLYGEWDVHHRYLARRLCGSADWLEFEGTMTCRPVLGGRGNVDEFRMPSRGARGATVRLFDPDAGRWSLHWASSLTGRFEPPVAGGFESGRGVFEGDDVFEGRPVRVRYVWDRIAEDGARWRQSLSPDAGETWEENWVMAFRRVGRRGGPEL